MNCKIMQHCYKMQWDSETSEHTDMHTLRTVSIHAVSISTIMEQQMWGRDTDNNHSRLVRVSFVSSTTTLEKVFQLNQIYKLNSECGFCRRLFIVRHAPMLENKAYVYLQSSLISFHPFNDNQQYVFNLTETCLVG